MTDSENANSTVLESGPIPAGMTSRRTPMTVGYRTIFRVPHDDAVSVTERNVEAGSRRNSAVPVRSTTGTEFRPVSSARACRSLSSI